MVAIIPASGLFTMRKPRPPRFVDADQAFAWDDTSRALERERFPDRQGLMPRCFGT